MRKIHDFVERHTNGVVLLVLACIMVIITSIFQIVPRVQSAQNYTQLMDSLGGEKALRSSMDENSDVDNVFSQSHSEKNIDYKDSEEYQNTQKIIEFQSKRTNDLRKNNLVSQLDSLTGSFLSKYSQCIETLSPSNLKELQALTTSECYKNISENVRKEKKGQGYLPNYIRFADLDKETVFAYVEMRFSKEMMIIRLVNETGDKWAVDDFEVINPQ